eukprot:112900-Prorocentrum_minimum.AAC.7
MVRDSHGRAHISTFEYGSTMDRNSERGIPVSFLFEDFWSICEFQLATKMSCCFLWRLDA